ncbi:sensor histidine kinase [Shewanella colwelliana]|uniref:sensor histidine kinase n=1 Tax=Shewanella colwelliana TaxID=23 RepID=UPI0022AFF3CA|nr:HAMP domain-containing sensor histidine kinase [Shewanella colwelliana]MCZ4337215.1 HAMP domain-containing sensor histidine kinase [Shewanella colwelliana]
MNHQSRVSDKVQHSAKSLTRKMSLYFSAIALLVGAILYGLSLTTLYWLEDELNRRTLVQTSPMAINAFRAGAESPLQLNTNIKAYNDLNTIPQQYPFIKQLPLGFVDELHDTFTDDLFVLRSKYQQEGETKPLIIIMNADQVELSNQEWRNINITILAVTFLLFILFGFAISKLIRRLVSPVRQLSEQLKLVQAPSEFKVSSGAALEFSELAASLNQYQRQIDKLIKQEQAFSRYASHELRTPLTVIQGAGRLLQQQGNEAFKIRQRDRIVNAANDMQNTIDALLSLVRHEDEHYSEQQRILTQAELSKVIRYVQPLADSKTVVIDVDIQAEPLIAPSEAVVRMLLINLLSNAINASEGGEIELKVNQEAIWVVDHGRGLTRNERDQQGHGLGLLIVDALCQRYQWQFSLQETDPGCIAMLHFPHT